MNRGRKENPILFQGGNDKRGKQAFEMKKGTKDRNIRTQIRCFLKVICMGKGRREAYKCKENAHVPFF